MKKRIDLNGKDQANDFGQRTENLKVATWNIRGITHKLEELNKELKLRNIDIAAITETKKKKKGSIILQDYVVIYSGVTENEWASSGTAIFIKKQWKNNILDYNWISDRIIKVRVKIFRKIFNIIGLYAPTEGDQRTERFYEELQDCYDKINKLEPIIIMGDLNARVGNNPIRKCIGTQGEDNVNKNGIVLKDFCIFNNLKITNTFFRHKDIHKYTWEARGTKSIIDYVIINEKLINNIKDTRVFRGSEIDSDHMLVESKFQFRMINTYKKKKKQVNRISVQKPFKIHLLEQDSIRNMYQRRLKEKLKPNTDDIDIDWGNIKETVTKAAEECLGFKTFKNKKWLRTWNQDLQTLIKNKKQAYKKYLQSRDQNDHLLYKKLRAEVRKVSRKVRREDWDKYVKTLEHDFTGCQRVGFKILKKLQAPVNDRLHSNLIPKDNWITHYRNLWNEDQTEISNKEVNKSNQTAFEPGDPHQITMEELEDVLKQAKNRKSPGIDNVNVELFKYGNLELKEKLLNLFNNIFTKKHIPKEWETGIVINLYKKGPRDKCENYRGITLLSTASKLYANILKAKLSLLTENYLEEEQCGFRKGRSCTDATFTIQQLIEKRKEWNLPTYIIFIDYEKAYDNINRNLLWEILEEDNIPTNLIEAIKSLYQDTKICIKLADGKITEPITTNKGVKQGCGLSPLLFNIYINKVIQQWKRHVIEGIQLKYNSKISTLLYADDQMIIVDSEDKLQIAVHELNKLVKKFKMKISENKTKAMGMHGNTIERVKIELNGNIIEQVSEFKYLGNIISQHNSDKDFEQKLQNFNRMNGIIRRNFGKQMSRETQLRLHKITAKTSLKYGSETWTLKQRNKQRLEATQMNFLRKLTGIRRIDKIKNTDIRRELGERNIVEEIEDYQRKWLEHVERMPRERLPKQALQYRPSGGKRDRGRPKMRWREQDHLN